MRWASSAVLVAALMGVSLPASADTSTDLEPVGSRTAAEQRDDPDPALTRLAERPARTDVPADRYAMAGGCYAMGNGDQVVSKSADGYALSDDGPAAPIHFQATELGRYLFWDADQQFVGRDGDASDEPSPDTEWTVEGDGPFTITESLLGETDGWTFRRTTGCPEWPDVELNVTGAPFAGTSSIQEVRGYVDDHTHQMATDFLGGGIHCGRPWHRYGVVEALKDCPDHTATGGQVAIPEIVLSGSVSHDPVGWPTFKDWPAPGSLTHEGVYYKWLERSWRGGQRIFVNLLVENEVLCAIYPNLGNPLATATKSCNDMDQVRHQAKLIRELEDYIDAQWGGPGKGWFRIVDTPEDARRIVNQGKLAVILGTETSDIFNCSKAGAVTELLDDLAVAPRTCSPEDLDEGLDELEALGVRQMVITHKFDNAFGGAKGDEGTNGIATNIGTFVQNGSFFRMLPCTGEFAPDNAQLGPDDAGPVAALIGPVFAAASGLPLPIALPIYAPGEQCNERGLTELGEQMIRKMAERDIIVDVDHFNSKSRSQALDVLDDLDYSGVISSHSWADPEALPRVYERGGFVAPYAGESASFAKEWEGLTEIMDGRFFWGVGYGADTNGLGAQGEAREGNASNPVSYPFSTVDGVKVDQQRSGERLYDINADGVAHYGLYPDWLQDLTRIEGEDIRTDMRRGSEAYLQMWERAGGATNDACREPELRRPASDFAQIARGTSARDVLYSYGQPHVRAGQLYRYCALSGSDDATVTVRFDDEQVTSVDGAGGAPRGEPTDDPGDDVAPTSGDDSGTDRDESAAAPLAGGAGAGAASDAADLPDAGGMNPAWPILGAVALLVGAVMVERSRRLLGSTSR